MPAHARKDSMNPEVVETHHVWSRCVRRAYLFGIDPLTGEDFRHRLQWLESLFEYLASIFAIDVAGFSWLWNHLHQTLRNRPDIVATWSDEMVVWRWKMAWPQFEDGVWRRSPTDKEIKEALQRGVEDEAYLPRIRRALADISWFQARLKQTIAVVCNQEQDKRGHFWEARYGNRLLEAPEDALTSLLYNDLQHVRAGLADSLEESDYSSIQRHIRARATQAFHDAHRRDADPDQDGAELEQLEAIFANCFISPLASDSPLMTVVEKQVPPSELVLPLGYACQQEAGGSEPPATEATAAEEMETDNPDEEKAGRNKQSKPAKKKGRRQPRRGQPRRKIHDRLVKQLRRRASRSAVLDIPFDQYYELAKRFERLSLDARRSAPPPPADAPPGVAPDSQTATSWLRSVKEFAAWVQACAAKMPQHLARRLLPSARGDPEEPD